MSPKSSTGQHTPDAAGSSDTPDTKRKKLRTVGVTPHRSRGQSCLPQCLNAWEAPPGGTSRRAANNPYGKSPRNGNTARRAARTAWSNRSAGSYPASQEA